MTRHNPKSGGLLNKKVFCRVSIREGQELEQWAEKEGCSVSFLVRHLLRRYLEDRRRFGVPEDMALPKIGGFL